MNCVEPDVCPGLFYATPARDGVLIRLRIPGGVLNGAQVAAIARVAQAWGCDTLQVTNRANLQLRTATAPRSEDLEELQRLGLGAKNKPLDRLRNLMASPAAGRDPQELLDPRATIAALDRYLQSEPRLVGLSSKFSLGIDGGGRIGLGTRSPYSWQHRYNEIQLSACELAGETYWQLALGGAHCFCETAVLLRPEECGEVVAALVQVYLDYVSGFSPNEKRRRMKHLLSDWGVESYLDRVSHVLSRSLHREPAVALPAAAASAHLGIQPQRQAGLAWVGASLPLGQATIAQWQGLHHLASQFSQGQVCLTPWQSVLLPDVARDRADELVEQLAGLGLSCAPHHPEAALVACAGKPGCGSARTHTQDHARALNAALREHVEFADFDLAAQGLRPFNVHLTACEKSCAQPGVGDLTLLGTLLPRGTRPVVAWAIEPGGPEIPRPEEELEEGYEIFVGEGGESLARRVGVVRAVDLSMVMVQLLRVYQAEGDPAAESLGEFVRRCADDLLREVLGPRSR